MAFNPVILLPFDPTLPKNLPGSEGFYLYYDYAGQQFTKTDVNRFLRFAPEPQRTTTTTDGTLTLSSSSTFIQILSGSATGFKIYLPDATTLFGAWFIRIFNTSTAPVMVYQSGEGSPLFTLGQTSYCELLLQDGATQAGIWLYNQTFQQEASVAIYNVVGSTLWQTATVTPYQLVSESSSTPPAGSYILIFNSSSTFSAGSKDFFIALFKAGTIIANSERRYTCAGNGAYLPIGTQTIVTVDGTEQIDARAHIDSSGTLSLTNRSLILIRFGT